MKSIITNQFNPDHSWVISQLSTPDYNDCTIVSGNSTVATLGGWDLTKFAKADRKSTSQKKANKHNVRYTARGTDLMSEAVAAEFGSSAISNIYEYTSFTDCDRLVKKMGNSAFLNFEELFNSKKVTQYTDATHFETNGESGDLPFRTYCVSNIPSHPSVTREVIQAHFEDWIGFMFANKDHFIDVLYNISRGQTDISQLK